MKAPIWFVVQFTGTGCKVANEAGGLPGKKDISSSGRHANVAFFCCSSLMFPNQTKQIVRDWNWVCGKQLVLLSSAWACLLLKNDYPVATSSHGETECSTCLRVLRSWSVMGEEMMVSREPSALPLATSACANTASFLLFLRWGVEWSYAVCAHTCTHKKRSSTLRLPDVETEYDCRELTHIFTP